MKVLESLDDLDEVFNESGQQPVMLFKHSTRCPISTFANNAYQETVKNHGDCGILFTHLDLIAHRDISKEIAERTAIEHQSPQAILIKNGKAVWNESHTGINKDSLDDVITKYA